jgi:hypothetical protein
LAAIDLTIEQLMLDASNPRFTTAANQRDTLQSVLDDQGDKLLKLAAHIAAEGLSPIDRLLVIREKPGSDRYISLEGNRRAAALKILIQPSILTTLELPPNLKKRFEAEAAKFDRKTVEPISAYEVKSRDDAKTWLFLRHTGENDGRGVVGWSGVATSRFRGSDPALQALEFVKTHGKLDAEEKQLLDEPGFPITTLDRLLDAVPVRKRLGVDVKEGKLLSAVAADELMKPLKRIVLDLARRIVNVSDLKNKDLQREYLDQLGPEHMPDLSKFGDTRRVEAIGESDFHTTGQVKKKSTSAGRRSKVYDPATRKCAVPPRFRLNIDDNKTAELFKELRTMPLEDFPLAISIELRVFLEHTVDHYMAVHDLPAKYHDQQNNRMIEKNLKTKVADVVDHLKANSGADPKDFAGITRALSSKASPFNVDLLHAYVHNRFVVPTERDLRAGWDEAQRFFELVWA